MKTKNTITSGLTSNGLPHGCIKSPNGGRKHDLVMLSGGPDFAHEPFKPFVVKMTLDKLQPLLETHRLHVVSRRRGMKKGSTVDDISNDAAEWIKNELRTPVDLVGISSGGSYALPLAANHPNLVRSLALVETAARLGDEGKVAARVFGEGVTAGKSRAACKKLMHSVYGKGWKGTLTGWMAWLSAPMFVGKNPDIDGGWIEIEAEEALDFRPRLKEVKCPCVVMGAENDPFYPVQLFQETAEGLPNARFISFGDIGHTLHEHPRFTEEMRKFLDISSELKNSKDLSKLP